MLQCRAGVMPETCDSATHFLVFIKRVCELWWPGYFFSLTDLQTRAKESWQNWAEAKGTWSFSWPSIMFLCCKHLTDLFILCSMTQEHRGVWVYLGPGAGQVTRGELPGGQEIRGEWDDCPWSRVHCSLLLTQLWYFWLSPNCTGQVRPM